MGEHQPVLVLYVRYAIDRVVHYPLVFVSLLKLQGVEFYERPLL